MSDSECPTCKGKRMLRGDAYSNNSGPWRCNTCAGSGRVIISATAIMHPRKRRRCEICGGDIGLNAHVRLYGMAHRGDKPYSVRICRPCCQNLRGMAAYERKVVQAAEAVLQALMPLPEDDPG